MKGRAKTQIQVLHNNYISTKPRTVTSSKYSKSSSFVLSVLDPEHQAMADLLRLSHSILSKQIPTTGREDY